jgi:hypothetical protein
LLVAPVGDSVEGVELYDLASDVSETHDRLNDHADIARRLEQQAKKVYQDMLAKQRPIGIRELSVSMNQ